ncbi:hypothetical protein ACSS6W_009388 [Trichoderma asperelloides]|nr:hypothetical protein LI328DRAFT_134107 [Trichoderma asperelloides]
MTAMWASPAFPALGLFALAFSSDSSHVPMSQVRQGLRKEAEPLQRQAVEISASRSRDYCWSIVEIFFSCSRPGPPSINPEPHGF